MRASIVYFAIFLLGGCEKVSEPYPELNGEYEGTFMRSSPTARYVPANVTIRFDGNDFTGSSDLFGYPSIGRGKFQLQGHDLIFENTQIWPAIIDGSLVLSGSFEYTFSENTLTLRRTIGSHTDYYRLSRK